MRIINLLNLNDMDKLIKNLESIVERYRTDVDSLDSELSEFWFGVIKGHDDVAVDISHALNRYKLRCQRKSKSCKEISFSQWRKIDELVDNASDFWDMLPDDGTCILTYQDYYRMGYINAVLRMMEIFRIDEKRVKK